MEDTTEEEWVRDLKVSYDDFVGVYRNVYPPGFCAHVISEFERLSNTGVGNTRQQNKDGQKHEKDDLSQFWTFNHLSISNFKDKYPVRESFFNFLQGCFDDYVENFSVLRNIELHTTDIKVQKTPPGGGYHLWHGEQGSGYAAQRVLTFILYLNSLQPEEAGETEFLYQKRRYAPEENTLVIWPAAFTHAHRGNTVFGENSKYIITGWFNVK